MANDNTIAGYYNLPVQLAALTTAQVIVVPAAGAYPSLPSPTLPAGAGLSINVPSSGIAGGNFDVKPFKIRVAGKANTTGAAATIIPILYQVNSAAVGVIGAAGSITSLGVVGTGTNLLHTCATIASSNVATVEFLYEFTLMFNSTAGSLGGFCSTSWTNFTGTSAYTINAVLSGGPVASGLKFADLNFEVAFTVSAATSPNGVQLTEFSAEQM